MTATACGSDEPTPSVPPPGPRLAVWLEFVDETDVGARLALAGRHDLDVHLALIRGEHGRDFLRTACAAAGAHGVTLRLWPLVEEEHGYWAHQANHETFSDWVDVLLGWAADDCPAADSLAVDMELPIERSRRLAELTADEVDVAGLLSLFLEEMDAEAFEAGRAAYAALADAVRAAGLSCAVSTLPMLVDDLDDGDESIARALWTPIQGIEWDEVSIQVYRSLFQRFSFALPDPDVVFSSGLVTSYAESMRAAYGDAAGLDLGTTGSGVFSESGLGSAAALQSDVAAALAAGIPVERLNVYSLEGLDGREDAAAWLAVPEPTAVAVDEATVGLREFIATLDAAAE